MNHVPAQVLHKFVIVYLDDIYIYSKTHEEHLGHLRTVFELLQANSLKLRLKKCTFAQTETKYSSSEMVLFVHTLTRSKRCLIGLCLQLRKS